VVADRGAGLHERDHIVLDYSPDGATLPRYCSTGNARGAPGGEGKTGTTGLGDVLSIALAPDTA